MSRALACIHPRLAQLPPAARRAAQREASRESFDAFELVVIAAACVPVFSPGIAAAAAASAIAAMSLRRCRRGLERILAP